ncbi:MAG: hypothetical protein AAF962_05520 [Actinomycetota bacterium]
MVAVLGASVALIGSLGSDGDAVDATSESEAALSTAASSGSTDPANLVALPASGSSGAVSGQGLVGAGPVSGSSEAGSAEGAAEDGTYGTDPEQQSNNNNENQKKNDNNDGELLDPTKTRGYDVHGFVDHVIPDVGEQMLAPGQSAYGGYQMIAPGQYTAQSTLTGLRPVIEQSITDVLQKDPSLEGRDLERAVAKRLTQLNDWKNLTSETKEDMMLLAGVDFEAMNKKTREDTINHLQHSPLPFGDIPEVLSPGDEIDLGYTHTLDKNWTQVAHLGDGVFKAWVVSNNNNGSHTGHIMGSFKVQLTPTTSLQEAKNTANNMFDNNNNNNKLYLDEAARKILYGQTPWLDYSHLTPQEKAQAYVGKPWGSRPTVQPNGPAPAPEEEETPTETTDTTEAPPETTETTEAPAEETGETTETTEAPPETTESTEETTESTEPPADTGDGG